VVGALHETLQQRRRQQQSPEFKLQMQQRNGIEGAIGEMVRGHGMRRARYRGFAKVDLQNQFVATSCNIKRWLQKLIKGASGIESVADLSAHRLRIGPSAPFTCVLARLIHPIKAIGLIFASHPVKNAHTAPTSVAVNADPAQAGSALVNSAAQTASLLQFEANFLLLPAGIASGAIARRLTWRKLMAAVNLIKFSAADKL